MSSAPGLIDGGHSTDRIDFGFSTGRSLTEFWGLINGPIIALASLEGAITFVAIKVVKKVLWDYTFGRAALRAKKEEEKKEKKHAALMKKAQMLTLVNRIDQELERIVARTSDYDVAKRAQLEGTKEELLAEIAGLTTSSSSPPPPPPSLATSPPSSPLLLPLPGSFEQVRSRRTGQSSAALSEAERGEPEKAKTI